MQYRTFVEDPQTSYPIAILVPQLDPDAIVREYIDPQTIDPKEVIAYELHQEGKKTSATRQREYLDDLLPVLQDLGTEYLIVGEAEYFKTLAGVPKAEAYLGYVLPSAYPADKKGAFWVIYAPNFRQVFHDPVRTRAKISQGFDALWSHRHGHYRDPGCDIIKFAAYPSTVTDIAAWLQKLIEMDCPLTADIEAFSLKHYDAGIGTISFAWSKHEGIAFPVDLGENPPAIRKLLAKFFRKFNHNLKWHNISYDVYVLIYQLYMEDLLDTEGLLSGLRIMLKNWDDTKLITYLATNSCAGNELGLKIQSQEFSGNYSVEDIDDITKIPLPKLLEYNLVDSLSTWYVYEKHWDTLVADDQLEIYEELFKPAIWDIIQMQLTGMPLDMGRVAEVKEALSEIHGEALRTIQKHRLVKTLTHIINDDAEAERRQDWENRKDAGIKVRAYVEGSQDAEFNPNSNPQLQRLFYELAALPIIEKTNTGQAATGKDVLEKLKAHTTDKSIIDLINAFMDYAAVDKLLTSFIPAFEKAVLAPDGCYYLFGSFKLGGARSGRLASSDPNLQNIPANVVMVISEALLNKLKHLIGAYTSKGKLLLGKLIKSCFKPPKGWLLVGLDFASLEDRISALTTRDPNKIKVYTDGYDGHSLRAHSYFEERMPDIELAPEGARCFRALIGDQEIWFHEQETITYLGQTMTGADLYARLSNVQVAAE